MGWNHILIIRSTEFIYWIRYFLFIIIKGEITITTFSVDFLNLQLIVLECLLEYTLVLLFMLLTKNIEVIAFINAFGMVLMLSIVVLSLWEVIDDISIGFLNSLAFPFLIILSIGAIFYYFFFHKNIKNDSIVSVL